MSMLEALLGKDYYLIELLVDPAHAGHRGTARPRKYIICHHKAKARYLYDVHFAYETVTRAIQKTVQTRPRDYLVAAKHQIRAHAARVAEVRRVPLRTDALENLALSFAAAL